MTLLLRRKNMSWSFICRCFSSSLDVWMRMTEVSSPSSPFHWWLASLRAAMAGSTWRPLKSPAPPRALSLAAHLQKWNLGALQERENKKIKAECQFSSFFYNWYPACFQSKNFQLGFWFLCKRKRAGEKIVWTFQKNCFQTRPRLIGQDPDDHIVRAQVVKIARFNLEFFKWSRPLKRLLVKAPNCSLCCCHHCHMLLFLFLRPEPDFVIIESHHGASSSKNHRKEEDRQFASDAAAAL